MDHDPFDDESSSATEQREKVVDFHVQCMDKHGVTEQDIHDAFDGGDHRTDDDFYKHFFCTAIKGKFMTEDGKVQMDNFEVDMKGIILPENMDNVAALVRKCLIERDSIMETIKLAVECFLKEEHGL